MVMDMGATTEATTEAMVMDMVATTEDMAMDIMVTMVTIIVQRSTFTFTYMDRKTAAALAQALVRLTKPQPLRRFMSLPVTDTDIMAIMDTMVITEATVMDMEAMVTESLMFMSFTPMASTTDLQ